jgi:hypothetical protein
MGDFSVFEVFVLGMSFLLAVLSGILAHRRGRIGIGYFFLGLVLIVPAAIVPLVLTEGGAGYGTFLFAIVLGPAISLLLVALLPSRRKAIESSKISAGDVKKCPDCAELVKSEARKCRFCGHEF